MFTVLRVYADLTSATEKTHDFNSALIACAIYLEDPDCENVKIWNTATGKIILDYWKGEC